MKQEPDTSEFGKFDATMRQILTVSKTELQKREKEWKRKRAEKKRAAGRVK